MSYCSICSIECSETRSHTGKNDSFLVLCVGCDERLNELKNENRDNKLKKEFGLE